MTFQPPQDILSSHRRWLSQFNPQYARNWEKLLKANAESASCEAAVRHDLEKNNISVEPNESLTGESQAPDFKCICEDQHFYVEVTCLAIEKVTSITHLTPSPSNDPVFYRPLNDAIFSACKNKTPQCAGQDAPVLLAIGTFHFSASGLCVDKGHLQMLLTGDELITATLDTKTGDVVDEPYLSTKLRSATFLRPDEEAGIDHARSPISGLLVCGFGASNMTNVYGLLHPSPTLPFDRSLLPDIEFCSLKQGYEGGSFTTIWD